MIRQLSVIGCGTVAAILLTSSNPVSLAEDTPASETEEWKAPQRQAQRTNPVAPDENAVAAGKALFVKWCLPCHGETGKGDGPMSKKLKRSPGNLADPKLWEQTDGALFWKITEGRGLMPNYKTWTEEQRWQVILHVRTLAPKPKEPSDGTSAAPQAQPGEGA